MVQADRCEEHVLQEHASAKRAVSLACRLNSFQTEHYSTAAEILTPLSSESLASASQNKRLCRLLLI